MFDLEIEKYNFEDMCQVLSINDNIETLNAKTIIQSTQKFKKGIQELGLEKDEIASILKFSDQISNKLLNYVEKRSPVQLPPTNFDILQSENQLLADNHAVINEKIIPTVNTYEYNYPTGTLNPVEKRTFTKLVSIDSLFRTNYAKSSSNDFTWQFHQPINNVVKMRLASFELPVMWYDISEYNKNNIFTIKTYNSVLYGNKTHTITIPSGNYNNEDIQIEINNILIDQSGGLQYLMVHIDPKTTKTEFRIRNMENDDNALHSSEIPYIYDPSANGYSPDFYYEIIFFEPQKGLKEQELLRKFNRTLGWFMGFRKYTYKGEKKNTRRFLNATSIGSGYKNHESIITSEGSFGEGKNHYIFISINDFNNNCINEAISSNIGDIFIGNNLLGRLAVNAPTYDLMISDKSDQVFKMREYLGPVTISKIKIQLLNKFGDLIDIQNNNFSLAIEFTILY